MLIALKPAIQKFNMNIRGIVHVGAHWGQEYQEYLNNGVSDIVFIEPCAGAFKVLQGRVGLDPKVILFQCACGETEGPADINVERQNQGQSNSLLTPKKHLEYHPEIQFHETESITIRRLDNLPFERSRYNLLMMDTQGAELMVLKGATETLTSMDYIYTEVNEQELYEGNALVTELDDYLKGFKRVDSYWVPNKGWGDAIYIRHSVLNEPLC